eukprot:g5264.t1
MTDDTDLEQPLEHNLISESKEENVRPREPLPVDMTALNGLRGFLSLYIVLFHCLIYSIGWDIQGSGQMSFFFLLSGFSLAVVYGKDEQKFDSEKFFRNRFARIFPQYTIQNIFALVLGIFLGWPGLQVLCTTTFTFLGTFYAVPIVLDGPAWTICTLVWCYIFFPCIVNVLRRKSNQNLCSIIIWLNLFQIFLAIVLNTIGDITLNYTGYGGFWIATASPPSRIWVFIVGAAAGILCRRHSTVDRAGHAARVQGWLAADPNGNGHMSLAECDAWIAKALKAFEGEENGERIWKAFRPSYIRAFNDAKDLVGGKGSNNNDYVEAKEFRGLCAYLCLYAVMYDAFSLIDGGGGTVDDKAGDDRKMSPDEWKAGYKKLKDIGFAGLREVAEGDEANAEAVFNEMDENKKGAVLLNEFCGMFFIFSVDRIVFFSKLKLTNQIRNYNYNKMEQHGLKRKKAKQGLLGANYSLLEISK